MAKVRLKKRVKYGLGRGKDPSVQSRKAEMQQLLLLYKPFPFGWMKEFIKEKPQYDSAGWARIISNTLQLQNSNLELCQEICEFIHRFKEAKLQKELDKAIQYHETAESLKNK